MSELKNKAKIITDIQAEFDSNWLTEKKERYYSKKWVLLEDAEKEIAHLTNLLKEVCEQGYNYEADIEGKVETYRKWLADLKKHGMVYGTLTAYKKFVEVFGEKKNET